MIDHGRFDASRVKSGVILVRPPFIWPDARLYKGMASYAELPPGLNLFADADLVSGVVLGASDATVKWIEELLALQGKRHICLVLVLYPAGPTRAEHLKLINAARAAQDGGDVTVDIRLLPLAHILDGDCERVILPPTAIQAHHSKTGRTMMSIGSVGDVGHDPVSLGSLNFVFQPDDAMRDAWRRWFQYVFSASSPLTPETCEIPHLVPAKGDREADLLWEAFKLTCAGEGAQRATPTVDPITGEVTAEANGEKTVAWDGGATALDPLAQIFQQVYASGWLVTVDEATRIKPLTIPVKATLLGQKSERMVGALKQKQSFTLQVLDDTVDKAIEKCRKVTDLMELLTYPLSQGNRWIPDAAKGLLDKELVLRNEQGQKALWDALGSDGVAAEAAAVVVKKQLTAGPAVLKAALGAALGASKFTPEIAEKVIEQVLESGNDEANTALQAARRAEYVEALICRRTESIRNDLNKMYRELGQGSAVPEDKLNAVLEDIRERLTTALGTRITPRAVYNHIGTPDLTVGAPEANWNQPLALLTRSARVLREMHTDPYFPRRFSGLAFTEEEFVRALNVFGDEIATQPTKDRAKEELEKIGTIVEGQTPAKKKCKAVWQLIRGLNP
jgi:hypothetical protein